LAAGNTGRTQRITANTAWKTTKTKGEGGSKRRLRAGACSFFVLFLVLLSVSAPSHFNAKTAKKRSGSSLSTFDFQLSTP
jgi:hypothetical protein